MPNKARRTKGTTNRQKKRLRAETSAHRKTEARAEAPTARPDLFPVVALGGSAGGLEAFEQFFKHLSPLVNAVFVVISHLDPRHSSMMSELIGRFTPMEVKQAADGVEAAPGHVYVIPPNRDLSIFHGKLQLTEPEKSPGTRMPIDFFLRSLAEDQGERGVAIILSGTGTDGTMGLRAVQAAGGVVFVQDPANARYDGMPRSAVQTGLADYILPVEKIPGQLAALLERYPKKKEPTLDQGMPDVVQKVLMVVRSKTGHDFSHYKKSTLSRRIQRRINLHNIEHPADYVRYLQEHREEALQLFKELLINVTSFFREPEAFEALKATILPELLRDKPSDYTLRVWVPGCATGEEAYSIAMIIREYAEETGNNFALQMFGTDIDESSITQARTGFFPHNIALDVAPHRLQKFFVKEETGYRVKKEIRESIVFALQSVVQDAPFTRLDLISCRNVLIYMEAELQSRLIRLFHYSLKRGGILFLGSSETIGARSDLFSMVERKWKFFKAKPSGGHEDQPYPGLGAWGSDLTRSERAAGITYPKGVDLEEVAHTALLSAFAPPAIVVNEKGDILYIYGQTGRYLALGPGRPVLNIAHMTREGLSFSMRSGLLAAVNRSQEAMYRGIRVKTDGRTETIDLLVTPLPKGEGEEPLFMFTFRPAPEAQPVEQKKGKGQEKKPETSRVAELEKELAVTKENLQAAVEEAQATTEELRSSNEELQSINEELQSTNEELETSKEELQSVNEELTTVNTELRSKIDQLSRSESDMKNLLDSTEIATIFLDSNLHVKRFTPSATMVINLIPTDIGRPIGDVTMKIDYPSLAEKAGVVLERLRPFESEVRTKDDRWFMMRMMPYRTIDDLIDGVVITFTDTTEAKRAAADRAEFAENILNTVREPLLVLDGDLRVVMANKSFLAFFGVTKEQTEGRVITKLGKAEWDLPVLKDLLSSVVQRNKVFEDFRVEARFPSIGPRTMLLNARKVKATQDGSKSLVLLAMEDITGK